jgi:prolyl oligopeptidase
MKHASLSILTLALTVGACATTPPPQPAVETESPTGPPETRSEGLTETIHGASVADPYRWLEDAQSEEVQAWMKAQDDYTRSYLHALPGRDELKKRLEELYYVETVSSPIKRGDRFFLRRRHPDREKAIVYWKEGTGGEEKVLLDPNTMGEEGENISLGGWFPSWDGKTVAYKLKANNADEATMFVMEVETGKVSDIDVIEGAKYAGASWTPNNDGFYYTWLPTDDAIPTADRPGHATVKFHKLGTDPQSDPVIHEPTLDPRTFLSPSISRDGRFLFVYKWFGWTSVEVYYRDLHNPEHKEFQVFWKPEDAQAYVTHWQGYFYIMTNKDAPRQSIWRTRDTEPARDAWTQIVPEPKDFVIDDFSIIGDHLVLTKLQNATSGLQVRTLEGELVREVELPGVGALFGVNGLPEDPNFYYGYTSYTTPWQIYETSVTSDDSSLWTEVKIPIDPSPYTVEQVFYDSEDGTKVSMFIVHRKDIQLDGSTPFLLYGYGGFQISLKPSFRSSIFPWLEAGGGYAVANLRGGGEYGEDWHKAGMLLNKQNTFDDFIAAAEFLVEKGYTHSDHLAIRGGSNGGLLVGATMTQRPDLFGAVVCAVPLLDMLRYHLYGSGKTWIAEYGSADDPAQFAVLHSYSPYHHAPVADYPALLLLSADNDDRVDPFHARKFAAVIQRGTSSHAPILLRIESQAGHGGADLVKQRVETSVDVYSFLMAQFGMAP